MGIAPRLAVRRVSFAPTSNFSFVAVTDRQEHILGVVQISPLLAVIFVHMSFEDGIYRAALFAKATENALCQVDVVTGRATRAVFTLVRLDSNGKCRADCFAQLAGDATLFAIGIATQGVQTPEARRSRCFFLRIAQSDLAF